MDDFQAHSLRRVRRAVTPEREEPRFAQIFIAADAGTVVGGFLMLRALRDKLTLTLLGLLLVGSFVALMWSTGWISLVFAVLVTGACKTNAWSDVGGRRQALSTLLMFATAIWTLVWLVAMVLALVHAGS